MTGIGIIILYWGYACVSWGVNAFQGNSQSPFVSQIFPFAQSTATSPSSTPNTAATKASASSSTKVAAPTKVKGANGWATKAPTS